jgi:carboxymethylenebutenolidase
LIVAAPADELRAVWAQHCTAEFELRDVERTLATMTDDPHLLNVPTGRGGRGREQVRRFYEDEFVGCMPDDARIESLGLAVGTTRLTEEVVLTFTHDRVMPWILDGIAPTGKELRVAQMAVVGFAGGKIAYEHIWWDQATVLVQLGRLEPAGLPVLGAEQADGLTALGDTGD